MGPIQSIAIKEDHITHFSLREKNSLHSFKISEEENSIRSVSGCL